MHDLSIIVTLAGGLAVALVFGWVTQRLGLSTLVGYMLAGIVVGPYTPGFVADAALASQMAEIGVILLMFGVGLHFHPQELLRVWRIAVPGAVAQSAVAAVAGWGLARAFGWSHAAGLVFGMALAVASTVVLMRMLVAQDRLSTRDGHVAVGWLIVEDLFTVLALVMLPALAAERSDPAGVAGALGLALGKAAVFAALVWAVGSRLVAPAMERDRPHPLDRALHADGVRRRARRRAARGRGLRRLGRARRLLRRAGRRPVAVRAAGGRRHGAVPRRLLRALLRLGRDAVQPGDRHVAAAAARRRARDRAGREAAGRARDRQAPARHAADRR